jgi:LEA14-like dessication related protein
MLPIEYQTLVIKSHEEYMRKNINVQVNKKEQSKIEILKGIKIYNENVDINLSLELDTYKSGKQKIKD